jgi:hypothetical protein
MKHVFFNSTIGFLIIIIFSFHSCKKDRLTPNNSELKLTLSEYEIFSGNPYNLIPNSGYKLYELASTLFSDLSEKQRLIKLPSGTTL